MRICSLVLALLALQAWGQDPDIRIAAPPSTRIFLGDVVKAVAKADDIRIGLTTDLTSLDALDAVANGKANIALMTRPLTGEDRSNYPAQDLNVVPLGMQVVAIAVSGDIWDAGIHSTQDGYSQRHLRAKDHQLEGTRRPRRENRVLQLPAGAGDLGDLCRVAVRGQSQGAAAQENGQGQYQRGCA